MKSERRIHVWRAPVVLGVATAVGLVAALLSDGGLGDVLSWLALAAPVAIVMWYVPRRKQRGQETGSEPEMQAGRARGAR